MTRTSRCDHPQHLRRCAPSAIRTQSRWSSGRATRRHRAVRPTQLRSARPHREAVKASRRYALTYRLSMRRDASPLRDRTRVRLRPRFGCWTPNSSCFARGADLVNHLVDDWPRFCRVRHKRHLWKSCFRNQTPAPSLLRSRNPLPLVGSRQNDGRSGFFRREGTCSRTALYKRPLLRPHGLEGHIAAPNQRHLHRSGEIGSHSHNGRLPPPDSGTRPRSCSCSANRVSACNWRSWNS